MMHDNDIATAADYADAMLIARRGKNVLVVLLILMILGQLALFFTLRYDLLPITSSASTMPSTAPAMNYYDLLHYGCAACLAGGLILTLILSFVLLLIVNIMLVGRLIGVSRLTSSYLWCLVLLVLLFPWQAFLNNAGLTMEQAAWKLPGVFYTWTEVSNPVTGATFHSDQSNLPMAVMKWTRYVGFPVIALLMLLVIQLKSNRGMRQALGEEEATPAQN